MADTNKKSKLVKYMAIAAGGLGLYLLFNSFTKPAVIPPNPNKPPRVKLSVSILTQSAYKTPLTGITLLPTIRYAIGTREEIDVVPANTTVNITYKATTDKGPMYRTNLGYMLISAIEITGQTALPD
jgi:hypothetical protein